MKVTVKVTQEMTDRRNGPADDDPGYEQKCMVAQALRPLVCEDMDVSVGNRSIVFVRDGRWIDVLGMPDEIQRKVHAYDEGRVVEPFEFELDIPADLLRDPERK